MSPADDPRFLSFVEDEAVALLRDVPRELWAMLTTEEIRQTPEYQAVVTEAYRRALVRWQVAPALN